MFFEFVLNLCMYVEGEAVKVSKELKIISKFSFQCLNFMILMDWIIANSQRKYAHANI